MFFFLKAVTETVINGHHNGPKRKIWKNTNIKTHTDSTRGLIIINKAPGLRTTCKVKYIRKEKK